MEIVSSPAEKDLRVLVEEMLDMTQQYVLGAQTTNGALGCIQSSLATSREGILPLCSAQLCTGDTPPAVLHPAPGSQDRKDMDLLEQVQRRPGGHQNDQRDGAALL
ncbi:hypothetical protein TURU_128766 [Turdus rufiventris]|nr:hypothetical protein TURU_128766 [Turdus rufiventris]